MTTSELNGVVPPPVEAAFDDLTLQVVEERLSVSKRRVAGEVVQISSRTETVEEVVAVDLDTYHVEITRVPVGEVVERAPPARVEGDTTIIPVLEERFVVVKQLILKEELHIRHVVEREVRRELVSLRRQRVAVDRSDHGAEVVGLDEA